MQNLHHRIPFTAASPTPQSPTATLGWMEMLPQTNLIFYKTGWAPSLWVPSTSLSSCCATLNMMLQSMPSPLLRQWVILPPASQSWVLASILFSVASMRPGCTYAPLHGGLPTDSISLKQASSLPPKPGQLVSVHHDRQILHAAFKGKTQKTMKNNDRNS